MLQLFRKNGPKIIPQKRPKNHSNVSGGNLAEYVERNRLQLVRGLHVIEWESIWRQTLLGMRTLHEAGMVHWYGNATCTAHLRTNVRTKMHAYRRGDRDTGTQAHRAPNTQGT